VPTTTIHFPEEVLRKVDAVARRRGVSRNRFVIQACEQAVAHDSGQWPEDLFVLSPGDQELLNQATRELEEAVLRNRANRGSPLL
jgi:acetolactate synthase regulatory subunit